MDPTAAGGVRNLHGFDSEGDSVYEGDGRAGPPTQQRQRKTRQSYRDSGVPFEPVQLAEPIRPRQIRPRAGTDPLARVDENAVLEHEPSFEWDGFEQDLTATETAEPLNNTRKWSAGTHFGVPAILIGNSGDCNSSSDGDGFLSPDGDFSEEEEPTVHASINNANQNSGGDQYSGGGDQNSGGGVQQSGGDDEFDSMDQAAWRRKVEKALLEANEDVLPFAGKRMTLECLSKLCALASSLKKELQRAHLELAEDQLYLEGAADRAAACRTALTLFLVEAEANRVELEEAARNHRSEASLAAAAGASAAAEVRRPLVRWRITAATDELTAVAAAFHRLMEPSPKSDEELFEKVEKAKTIEERHATAAADGKEVSKLALEDNLIAEGGELEEKIVAARKAKLAAAERLLAWRKAAGLWSEKKRRPDRGDLKLPTYAPGLNSRTTVYEFEKEWREYSRAMEYSKEEAVKVLKQAVQPPARADIANHQSVEQIFDYLKKHHGNPMMLLHAKEQEVRGWALCRGTDMVQREWLVQAKSKLEDITRMCKEHGIEKYLHFSTVAGDIQSKLPEDLIKDFKTVLKKHLSPSGVLEKELIIGLLLNFLEDKIMDCTLGVNLDIVNYLGTNKEDKLYDSNQKQQNSGSGGRSRYGQGKAMHAANQQSTVGQRGGRGGNGGGGGGSGGGNGGGGSGNFQVDNKCLGCSGHHSHLFYCELYINADLQSRFDQVRKQKACARCLGMKVKLVGRRDDWHPLHEKYCKTRFACKEGNCSSRPPKGQFHITLCRHHPTENKHHEADFIKSLDQNSLPAGCQPTSLQFLHMGTWLAFQSSPAGAVTLKTSVQDGEVYEVFPDVPDAAVFMMQSLPSASASQPLLAFYDSGCGGAGISDRAYNLLHTQTVRNGPTVLDVAGGKCVEIPYGDEQFTLQLDGGRQLATITALRMPHITSFFPMVKLTEAWEELAAAASSTSNIQLPTVDETIGGGAVDFIVGIKYLKYFPVLVFSLPSGLAIYRAKFKSYSGHQAVLGGPHAAWSAAAAAVGHMNPRAYLTSEARAWCVQESWVRLNQDKFCVLDNEADPAHCASEAVNVYRASTVKTEEKEFLRVEDVGSESPYRCESCRCCQKCKRADELEEISFREEAEQSLIESSVELDTKTNRLVASLPFIEDPAKSLTPNRHIAECVLKSQLALFKKRPDMREDTVRSHEKLLSRGYVKADSELTREERAAIAATPGDGYFIPWRIVHNEGSISTPCRMVFDASSKTPGGNSLNGVLAKGKNRLVKLQNLLARFRQRSAAVTADISMAYNGTWLKPEFIKYQKYLWKEDLEESKPTIIMYVLTLIYGVKPSGNQCQVSIERLADHFTQLNQHAEAVRVLKEDVYVDDIMSSCDSVQECYEVAIGVEAILGKGQLQVKAFSFSGQPPDSAVSADGVHVGLAGYLWRPAEDQILLDIGPPRLGKAKRGKSPAPVTGDFGAALKSCFTRRTLAGLVARVFDPLGLATPVTAGLKLDLHDLCSRKLDWDDPVPMELLEVWSANMMAIQNLKEVFFHRSIIPEDAASCKVDLLVAVDASQYLAAAAIYGRVRRKSGQYSCQLLMARSKVTASLTIPRAEMRSAVMGAVSSQVIKRNLGTSLGEVIYVTDSTICLHWIHQDDRPLQVAVRNAVIEVRRFTQIGEWLHVDSHNNVADLATRKATVDDVRPGSAWQEGYDWMKLSREQMPVRTAEEVVLTAEEKRNAAAEMRSKDIHGHSIMVVVDKMAARYAYSNYIIDPCRLRWSKVVRIMALVLRAVDRFKRGIHRGAQECAVTGEGGDLAAAAEESDCRRSDTLDPGERASALVNIHSEELKEAEQYFFIKATEEVRQFSKMKEYKNCSTERDGILYFTGRLLDGQGALSLETVMFDLNPLSFCQPIVDRFSPVAYSIMIETHWSTVNHLNAACTFRESLSHAYVIGGRDLAQEIRNSCVFCKRFKAKLLEVEMGKIHETRLSIAPPFTICQVDLLGPYSAQCEHNHRATVKVWGVIFKDPASGAIFVHAMSKCDTSAFIQAYTRFASRFCHPQRLYPDEGSQLVHGCREMELSWVDVAHSLNAQHGVGVEFYPCPVGGHNAHGMVERSIREVKKLFDTTYRGIKLDLLGYETAFSWISNEINNLPICIGSRYRDLDHLDLLTPNRLIHGRSNKRALSGCCMIGTPSAMLERMEDVFQAWWKAWSEEKIADFVARPVKWLRSDKPLAVGDIVVFLKTGEEQALGEPIWRIGRVVEVEQSEADSLVRTVIIEYKNAQENKFRTTRRSVRKVAVLHREDELELVQELNAAAREAERLASSRSTYLEQQEAVFREVEQCQGCQAPHLCARHSQYYLSRPYVSLPTVSQEGGIHRVKEDTGVCSDELCKKVRIHSDPWSLL